MIGKYLRPRDPYLIGSVCVATLFVLLNTMSGVTGGGNEASRFALIESLVERGTTTIDDSRYNWTGDKIIRNGKYFSNKPPLLAIIGCIPAGLLHQAGFRFADDEKLMVYAITLTTIGSAAIVTMILLYFLYLGAGFSRLTAAVCAVSLIVASQFGVYALTMNNHSFVGMLILGATYIFLNRSEDGSSAALPLYLLLIAAIGVEPVHGLFFSGSIGLYYLFVKKMKKFFLLAFALFVGILFLAAINILVHDHPLPPTLIHGGYDYQGSAANPTIGALGYRDGLPVYLFHILFGHHGLLPYSPLLILATIGFFALGSNGRNVLKLRFVAMFIPLSILFHGQYAGGYSGWSFGYRYFVAFLPTGFLFLPYGIKGKGKKILLFILGISGFLVAMIGAYHPWPPSYMGEMYNMPGRINRIPILGNLLAFLREREFVNEELERAYFTTDRGRILHFYNRFYQSQGKSAIADRCLEEALLFDSEKGDPVALRKMGDFYFLKAKPVLAIGYYRRLDRIGQATIDDLLKLATLLLHQKRYRDAVFLYRKVLKVDPENPVARHNAGVIENILINSNYGE